MAAGGMGMPQGISKVLVVSDENGAKRLFITFFESREAIEAAEPAFDQMGSDIPEEIRGKRTSVDVYEVVFQRG